MFACVCVCAGVFGSATRGARLQLPVTAAGQERHVWRRKEPPAHWPVEDDFVSEEQHRIQPTHLWLMTTSANCLRRSFMQPHAASSFHSPPPNTPRDTKPSTRSISPRHLSAMISPHLQSSRSTAYHSAESATTQIRNTSTPQPPKISSLLWP